jgi:TraX protein
MPALTAFDLKVLAFTFMFIDHIGRVFMDGAPIMVAIGRLSFPLFAWLAAQGEQHTRNIRYYMLRLVVVGAISQPFYALVYQQLFNHPAPFNILFTLAIGVGLLRAVRRIEQPIAQVSLFVLGAGLIGFLPIEGGSIHVLSIGIMAQLKPEKQRSNLIWYGVFVLLQFLNIALFQDSVLQLFSLIAPLLILCYNQHQGMKLKWFYLIYPLHFIAILAFKQYLMLHP